MGSAYKPAIHPQRSVPRTGGRELVPANRNIDWCEQKYLCKCQLLLAENANSIVRLPAHEHPFRVRPVVTFWRAALLGRCTARGARAVRFRTTAGYFSLRQRRWRRRSRRHSALRCLARRSRAARRAGLGQPPTFAIHAAARACCGGDGRQAWCATKNAPQRGKRRAAQQLSASLAARGFAPAESGRNRLGQSHARLDAKEAPRGHA